jgi:hypothetical protein
MKRFTGSRFTGATAPARSVARAIALLAIVTTAIAGCDVHGVSDPGTLATLRVSPTPTTMVVNSTRQFSAIGADFSGAIVSLSSPAWSVASGGGTISNSGLFTAGTVAGTFPATVVATIGGLSANGTVTVTAGPLATIVVTPTPVTLARNATQTFTAVGTDAFGNVVAFTPNWSVVAGGGAVSNAGVFTAGTVAGTYTNTVQASSGAIAGRATVTVTPGAVSTITVTPNPVTLGIGAVQQFTAVARDASNNIVTITPTWSVAAGGGVISTTGQFTAGTTPGTYTNTARATSGTISGSATVTVTSGALATLTVTPNPANLSIGQSQQFTVEGRDGSNNVIPVVAPTWAVVAGGGSIGGSSGMFTAGNTAGTYTNTVRVSSGTITGFATVNVVSGPLATITVSPNPVTIGPGSNRQFTAVGRDAGNNIVSISPAWTVTNGGGTIDGITGVFTAGNDAGIYSNTVRATDGTIFGTATVTVSSVAPPPPASLLGSAAANGIMAGTEVTCVIGGLISADVAISPGSTITGFPPCTITGVQNLGNAIAAQNQIDLTTAYNTLAGMACAPANMIVADLGGTTKPAGVYCSATSIGVTGTLTLDGGGDPNAMFVFQAGSALTTAGNIVLINGAQAKNVWWQVGSSATIGTASQWQGNIVALTSITLVDNATLFGRALARNGAVTLGTGNTITLP